VPAVPPSRPARIGAWIVAGFAVVPACGSAGPDAARATSDADCRAPLATCLAAAAVACTPERAWTIELADLPSATVTAGGLLRLDHLGGVLLGLDATHLAACFADCPGGGGERLCFPLELPLHLAWQRPSGCATETAPAPPWNGRPSRRVREACDTGGALRVVPAAAPVAAALVAAGVIDAADPLATADGLVVEAGFRPDEPPAFEIRSIAPARCDAAALPAGYRLALGSDDLAALDAIAAEPTRQAEARSRALLAADGAAALRAARDEVLAWVAAERADACRAAGHDPADPVALETCGSSLPETEPRYAAAVATALRASRRAHRAELDAITREALIGPVCRAYAARR
jgi:hypothetical protein